MASIIEMVIVLAAAALLTMQGIREDIAHRRAALLATEGQNQAIINEALAHWVTDNYSALLAQFTASGSATLTPPTIDQLYAGGNLKLPHRNGPFWGGTYTITMTMVPATCSATAGNCHVAYLFYPSQPLLKGGQPDVAGASQIAQAGGTSFGYSNYQNAATVTGLNGAWHTPNPLPGNPPAAIVATNALDSDGNSVYIRRDGSLTWTGSQNVNGVDLHNVGNIDATGTIAAPTVAASNVAVSNSVRSPATLYVQNQSGTGPAPIDSGPATIHGNATVTGTLTVGSIAAPGTGCSGTGIAGNSDGSGQVLSCQYGMWVPIGGRIQGYGYYTVQNGQGVPAPVCPRGATPQILINPRSIYVDTTATVNYGIAGSGPWTIYIMDGTGAGIQGQVSASTYCAY
ncbi:hypothetical protein PQR66_27180 [Paraburkholderia agricolaris]|uniref:Shufflon protein, N-terminal constant region n=1 Tax=Paraburkholderia agricolaris TaxID=2152888 RepID=A0ABW8ZWM7_9BURK